MKKKVLIIIIILSCLTLGTGLTYSFFNTNVSTSTTAQNIAKFVFNDSSLDNIEISLDGILPGDIKEYNFLVSNTIDDKKSNVSVDYQIIVHTYHFIPVIIELYSIDESEEELLMTCNENNYQRNKNNELICDMDIKEMSYTNIKEDQYKLKVIFPSEYNSSIYSSLVDYINLEIKSWQKIG